MIKYVLLFITALSLGTAVLIPMSVSAQDIGLEYGATSGLKATDPRITIARIVNVLLGLLGIITVIIILYAGFMWMTAGGNGDQVDKAKHMLRAAVVGLAIVFSAWTITTFLLKNLYHASTGEKYYQGGTFLGPDAP